MTHKKKTYEIDPYIWLQNDERKGVAACGCTLVAEHAGGGSAFWLCDEHDTNYAFIRDNAILAECLIAAFGGILHPAPPPLMTPDQLGRAIAAFREEMKRQDS